MVSWTPKEGKVFNLKVRYNTKRHCNKYKYITSHFEIVIDVKTIITAHVLFKRNFMCGVGTNFDLNNKYGELL